MTTVWRIRLGAQAEKDFAAIARYTRDEFGRAQAEIYKQTLLDALGALALGPDVPGSAARDEILHGLRTLHVARRGRRGRHFILYRAGPNHSVDVIRILHDAMDLARHVPADRD